MGKSSNAYSVLVSRDSGFLVSQQGVLVQRAEGSPFLFRALGGPGTLPAKFLQISGGVEDGMLAVFFRDGHFQEHCL